VREGTGVESYRMVWSISDRTSKTSASVWLCVGWGGWGMGGWRYWRVLAGMTEDQTLNGYCVSQFTVKEKILEMKRLKKL
jgi:hypothetical protein